MKIKINLENLKQTKQKKIMIIINGRTFSLISISIKNNYIFSKTIKFSFKNRKGINYAT
jgi:hypothetical protein